jgi:hypothetical protein
MRCATKGKALQALKLRITGGEDLNARLEVAAIGDGPGAMRSAAMCNQAQ